ncbi:uncharacterized protein LOC113005967 [Solenopsis invicta]|uniref:uncharacterized protein LOC113005967 n=1 Tax=Solenopsis invicta TaxID=13686 RepID=UPI00193D2941|nr:uncharacterized protein LOC113005967 [Solenopsis invicta]
MFPAGASPRSLRTLPSGRGQSRRSAVGGGGVSLNVDELEAARLSLIQLTQSVWWERRLVAVRRGQALPKRSSLVKLSPFLDDQGILRVGRRLRHSLLSYDEKHPVILPRRAHLTRLVIEDCHRAALHGGTQATLGLIRHRYWIPGGRAAVKAASHRCLPCVRWRAATPTQRMADLPRPRVVPSRPFLHAGVNYAGPVMLRTSRGRRHKAYKAFVAVFVCLSSRAVHLEVVSNYSSEAFLAALKRFTSRRGLCHTLYSDCGTNFVGADRQLRDLFADSTVEGRRVADGLSNQGIRWRFNPPAAPHFGGLWEAAVKSMKHHFRRVLGETTLTFEEMTTLLAQVKACMNSRPLQALSDDL